MTADLLREAAAEMRHEAGLFSNADNALFHAIADWLDHEAELDDLLKTHCKRGIGAESHCVKVAAAYLGGAA
jgi:hypothetical protein